MNTAAQIVADRDDRFLHSDRLDLRWIDGWHTANTHAVTVLSRTPVENAEAAAALVVGLLDQFPSTHKDDQAWVAGWRSSLRDSAATLTRPLVTIV